MAKQYVCNITGVEDETQHIIDIVNEPPEVFYDCNYINISFYFTNENSVRKQGSVQLLFENNSYEANKNLIPSKGSSFTLTKKKFIFTSYKVDIVGLGKFVNVVHIDK